MRRVLLVTSLVAAAIAAIGTGTAGAFTITCAYSGQAQQVTITMAGANAFTNVSVGAGGAILDDGAPCDVATLANTTSIVATGDATGGHTFSIDLSGGPFIDPNTSAELHFTVDLGAGPADTFLVQGSSGPDSVVAGANGVNLDANAGPTVDVTLTGAETFQATGGDGNDVFSGNGGRGTGVPLSFRDVLRGDGGNDVLLGTPVTDSLRGGPGNDLINGFGGEDTAEYILAPTSVFVSLAGGFALGGDGSDLLANIEDISGSSHDDVLIGDGGPNSLSGLDATTSSSASAATTTCSAATGTTSSTAAPGRTPAARTSAPARSSTAPDLTGAEYRVERDVSADQRRPTRTTADTSG